MKQTNDSRNGNPNHSNKSRKEESWKDNFVLLAIKLILWAHTCTQGSHCFLKLGKFSILSYFCTLKYIIKGVPSFLWVHDKT